MTRASVKYRHLWFWFWRRVAFGPWTAQVTVLCVKRCITSTVDCMRVRTMLHAARPTV